MTSDTAHNRIQITNSHNSRTSLISSETSNKPIGIRFFGLCYQFNSTKSKQTYHKALVLILTFIAYAAFHMGRRPLSVVKNVLNRNCSALVDNNNILSNNDTAILHTNIGENNFIEFSASPNTSLLQNETHLQVPPPIDTSCDWAPFDDNATANQLLAILDSSFLLSYAVFMFISGIVAERMNLRYFITIGSILSGLGLVAFGLAYPLNIHSMTYFLVVQIVSGAAQTAGWPVVVTCISNWFAADKRGLIYGFWNSHTNIGNIVGATIAGFFVEKDWGLSFIVPGAIMIAVGIILFLFLVPTPQDVNLSAIPNEPKDSIKSVDSSISNYDSYEKAGNVSANGIKSDDIAENATQSPHSEQKAVSFLTALRIPGVIEYSFCLFFSKLVSYTFLYWLPRYITSSTSHTSEDSAYLSTPFDVGGVVGAILAGYFSDRYRASGITCNVMLILAIPSMFVYQKYGALSSTNNILLQLLVGGLVNGPYCLITTAVSADLGDRIQDGRAMATVAAIIDGMGSIGAVLGPLFAGFVSNSGDWQSVFIMLMLADVFASLCLIRITVHELKEKFSSGPSANTDDPVDTEIHV